MTAGSPPEGGSTFTKKRGFLTAGSILLVVILLSAAAFSLNGGDDGNGAKASEGQETIRPDEVPGGNQPSGTQAERTAATKYLLSKGYQVGQFSFTVVKPINTERGAASVSEEPVCTVEKLKRFIQSGSDRAKAYLRFAKENLPDVDYNRIRRGEGFVRVQLLVPSEYTKNSYFTGGRVVSTSADRSVQAGDIVFLYTSKPVEKQLPNGRREPTSEVREMGNTRCQCGNGGAVPVPVTGPPAPPVKVPPPPLQPPGKPPHQPPGQPPPEGKPPVPIRSIPGSHEAGHGADQPPKSESEYQGGPPREKAANPPVVTPPDTGGSIPPGGSGPPNDSAGGTVPQPTAPPTTVPDETAPPAPKPTPEQEAPPPPE